MRLSNSAWGGGSSEFDDLHRVTSVKHAGLPEITIIREDKWVHSSSTDTLIFIITDLILDISPEYPAQTIPAET